MPRSRPPRTSNISICPRQFAAATSTLPKPGSNVCAMRAITAASRRCKTRSPSTSRASLTGRIVFADRATGLRVSMFDFDALSTAIVSQTVLCVGDLMLDEFVYGEVSRISPEAPAPVIAVQRSVVNVGGAGNVARNIAALGARCIFVGLIGEDDAGRSLKAELAKERLIEPLLVSDPSRPTTRKVRFVSEHFSTHMLRADWETAAAASAGIEQKLIDTILPQLERADIVLLSDYAKGRLTARVIRNVIDAARALGKRG